MNVFQLFFGSFHSAAAYRFMRAKATFGMGYALFVVTMSTLFVMLYFGIPVYVVAFMPQGEKPPLFDSIVRQIAAQTPIMTLKGDTLATKTPERTVITIKGSYGTQSFDLPFATIDTTGKTTTDDVNTPVLITAKDLYLHSSKSSGWEPQPLIGLNKDGPNTIIINHAVADEWATQIIDYTHGHLIEYFIYVWIIAITCLFVVTFFTLLILGLIGLVLAQIIKSPLSFPASVSLAALSFTPVALLDAVLLTVFGYAPHAITLLAAGTVTLYAAIKCSDPVTPTVTV